ncbi:nuclear transport factor 2 family protein [Naasia sp. SYSU D00948]|uniref:nuclear transport factor 2 family protein n=1 Tax=Naasia sp. SYSU D00948 TaxID=2817379 RepID=UPI001B30D984|nr:nuclear transport factor 2 family protein [Naasia sp. SYSU D00948]
MSEWDDVTDWMDRYRTAWTTNDPGDIRALFTEDAEYRYNPWDEPVAGIEAIVDSWLEGRDEPGDWTFEWHPLARDGDTVFVEGRTAYRNGRNYRNLWVIVLGADGRASRFTEWYMKEPDEHGAG